MIIQSTEVCFTCTSHILTVKYGSYLGAFIVDAADYLDKASASDAAAAGAPKQLTKLIITSDCMDLQFINLMLRYTSYGMILKQNVSTDGAPARGANYASTFSPADAARSDVRKGARIVMRRKLNLSGMEDKTLFSSVTCTNDQILCIP